MKVLLSVKESEYESLSEKEIYSTHLSEFLRSHDPELEAIKKSSANNQKSLESIAATLADLGIEFFTTPSKLCYETIYLDNKEYDLIISAGGDGTFLRTARFVLDTPILGVNTDPGRSVGYYCCSSPETLKTDLQNLENLPKTKMNRLEFLLDGEYITDSRFFESEVPLYALNEALISHHNPAASTTLQIDDGSKQKFKSSGLIVAAAGGSTGLIKNYAGMLLHPASKGILYSARSLKSIEPKIVGKLSVKSYTVGTQINVDGFEDEIEFPVGSELKIHPGRPITVIGDMYQKQRELLKASIRR